MSPIAAPDPDFARKVRESFARQRAMSTLGASLVRVAPGEVDIALPYREDLTQQHGFLHGGVVAAIVDSACGYAALSVMPAGTAVLTVEFKVNLLAPARATAFLARGRVARAGRSVIVCTGEVVTADAAPERGVALMQATMMVLEGRSGLLD